MSYAEDDSFFYCCVYLAFASIPTCFTYFSGKMFVPHALLAAAAAAAWTSIDSWSATFSNLVQT